MLARRPQGSKRGQIGWGKLPDSLTPVELLAENEGYPTGSGKSPGLNRFAFSGFRADYFVVLRGRHDLCGDACLFCADRSHTRSLQTFHKGNV